MNKTVTYLFGLTIAVSASYAQAKMSVSAEFDLSGLLVETISGDAVASLTPGASRITIVDGHLVSTVYDEYARRDNGAGLVWEALAGTGGLQTSITNSTYYNNSIADQWFDVNVSGSGDVRFSIPYTYTYTRDKAYATPPDGERPFIAFTILKNDDIFGPVRSFSVFEPTPGAYTETVSGVAQIILNTSSADPESASYSLRFGNSISTHVITPVPEPETYALLIAGLGLTGMVARRRKTLKRF